MMPDRQAVYRQTQMPRTTRQAACPDGAGEGDGEGAAVWVGDGVPDGGGTAGLLGFAGAG
jgi:hypothetical protein